MIYDSIIDIVGKTPLITLDRSIKDARARVMAKMEGMNPGLSSKDRTALFMMEDASKEVDLENDPVFIESSSGNTGYSLAMFCARKGYRCIITMPAKSSQEKKDALKALGVELHVCENTEFREDENSYYSLAKRLNDQIPNSVYLNQYFSHSNIRAHYETTGPELWEQTDGRITHFICGVGTGGTISGAGRFLKERNPDIQVIGVDAVGSLLSDYFDSGELDQRKVSKYLIEGIGKNFIPGSLDNSVIDYYIDVNDEESAQGAYDLARKEGILAGYSSGAVLAAFRKINNFKDSDLVVLLLPDHGCKYLSKLYNENWLEQHGLNSIPKSEASST